jgi:hypothetical protein
LRAFVSLTYSSKSISLLIKLNISLESWTFSRRLVLIPRDDEGCPLTGAKTQLCLLFCHMRYIQNSLLSAKTKHFDRGPFPYIFKSSNNLDSWSSVIMASTGLVSIASACSTRTKVNTIGVVVDKLDLYKTRGSSYGVTFTIKDCEFDAPTWQGGLKVKYFNDKQDVLPIVEVNDVVLLRGIRVSYHMCLHECNCDFNTFSHVNDQD